MCPEVRIVPTGDTAVTIYFKQEITEEVHRQVQSVVQLLKMKRIKGVTEWVPAYASITIYYDPLSTAYKELLLILEELIQNSEDLECRTESRLIEIPTLYGDEWGVDLEFVAQYNQMSIDQVVKIHSAGLYRVYMLGFAPGFPYLGGMSERISAPRLENPRMQIPAGSVGIAGNQTGIYPLASPAGWRIIGRTPIKLFNPERKENPILLQAGDLIRFVPITREKFAELLEDPI
jgi:inhibitor of KinA